LFSLRSHLETIFVKRRLSSIDIRDGSWDFFSPKINNHGL
jgi:hypothetical protein